MAIMISTPDKRNVLWNIPLETDIKKVKRFLRFKEGKTELSDSFTEKLEKNFNDTLLISNPSGIYATIRVVKHSEEYIKLDKFRKELNSKLFVKKFSGAEYITVLAVTLGKGIMEYMEAQELSDRVISDATASESVEFCAEYINNIINRDAHRTGFSTTMRFSPGYGKMSIDIQPEIIDFLKTEDIGLSVSESCILVPEKSITAFIGWVPVRS
ncbi:MAG: hypothetical protein KAS39_08520 [Actinomycetia bacterium]|nr:hypothetical protein [Actinomycetes bacterium]